MKLTALVVTLLLTISASVLADETPLDENYVAPEFVPWKESDYTLPPFPKDENLADFYVSPVSGAKFYIDRASIGTGTDDNIVRYVMVGKSTGGATNISYEGIRCDTSELRIYATGNANGEWTKSRKTDWKPFTTYNLQQKVLASMLFCPDLRPIRTADEGRTALLLGVHPQVAQRYRN